MEDVVIATFKGNEHHIRIRTADDTPLKDFMHTTASELGIVMESMKVILPGGKLLRASGAAGGLTVLQSGLRGGMKVMVVGSASAEVQAVRESRDLPAMAGFDHELRTLASRRQRSSSASVALPSGPYTFRSFEAWGRPGLRPAASEATKLLHQLAADPGIVSVMREHRWGVGKLSEMPPEGKVGVSAVCILGVNINAGQEISLRLRTDDLKGFRRYQSIRDTLCHELAHMVWSDHDDRFKTLNSQIRSHVDRISGSAGQRLFQSAEGWSLDAPGGPQDAMAATKASSGMTLRQLAGGRLSPALQSSQDGRAAVVEVEALGHRDAATEAKEAAVVRLMEGPAAAEKPHPEPQTASENPAEASAGPTQAATMIHHQGSPPHTSSPGSSLQRSPDLDPAPGTGAELEDTLMEDAGGLLPVEVSGSIAEAESPSGSQQAADKEEETASASTAGGVQPAEGPAPIVTGAESGPSSKESELEGGEAGEADAQQGAAGEYMANAMGTLEAMLRSSEPGAARTAIATLLTILKNALQHPKESRYQRIKLQNAAFQSRVGRLPGAMDLLKSAGFMPIREGEEQVLRLVRDDPGLLWITLAACESALQRIDVA